MPSYSFATTHRRAAPPRSSWRTPPRGRRRYRNEMPLERHAVRPRPASRLAPSRFLALALAGLLAFAIGQLLANDAFYVYRVEVSGNRLLAEGEIFEKSGIAGHNIFWVRPQQVSAALMSDPYVKSARVQVGLPNRVRITIVEREPRLAWDVNGAIYWADEEGVLLPRREGDGDLITLIDPAGQAALDEGHLHPEVVAGTLEVHRLLPELKALQYARHLGLHFQLPEGTVCYLGDEGDLKAKVALLNALRQNLAVRGVQPQLIDLRYEGSPYYR